jgi:hypothetical protein
MKRKKAAASPSRPNKIYDPTAVVQKFIRSIDETTHNRPVLSSVVFEVLAIAARGLNDFLWELEQEATSRITMKSQQQEGRKSSSSKGQISEDYENETALNS